MTDDFYALLELPTDASEDEIRDAFREKVTEYHPDHNDDPRANAQFTALKKAYDTLGDPVERQAYDRLGHKDYVAKRLDGLPDADQWSPVRNDDNASESTESTTNTAASGRSSSGSRTSSGSRSSGSRTSSSTTRSNTTSSRSETNRSSSSHTSRRRQSADQTSSSSRTTASGSQSSSTSGRSSQATDRSSSGSVSASSSGTTNRTSRSATASDGAGTTNPSRAHTTATSGSTSAGSSAGGTAAPGSTLRWLSQYEAVRFLLGWPLVYLATLVYAAGLTGYGYRRQDAVIAYAEGLVAAGSNPDAIMTALGTRGGLDPLGPAIIDGLLVADPVAAVLAVGVVGFPTVLFVLVRLTRISPGWKPTYLYVVLALGPITGVGYGIVTAPLIVVELLLFLGAPLLTLGALLGYAKVRPRIVGLLS